MAQAAPHWCKRQQGTGTFVAHRKAEKKTAERRKALERLVDQALSSAAAQGFATEELAEANFDRAEESGRR